ncbi:MAG: hypothetical protein AAF546_14300 [Verrucomicrobiota bacterium]
MSSNPWKLLIAIQSLLVSASFAEVQINFQTSPEDRSGFQDLVHDLTDLGNDPISFATPNTVVGSLDATLDSFALTPTAGSVSIAYSGFGTFDSAAWTGNDVGINGLTGGLGVDSSNRNFRLGDAVMLEFTFTGFDLDKRLQLTNFGAGSGSGVEYQIWLADVSVNTATVGQSLLYDGTGGGFVDVSSNGIFITDGDFLVLTRTGTTDNNKQLSQLTFDVVAVPEVSSFGLFAGVVALVAVGRRRRG